MDEHMNLVWDLTDVAFITATSATGWYIIEVATEVAEWGLLYLLAGVPTICVQVAAIRSITVR